MKSVAVLSILLLATSPALGQQSETPAPPAQPAQSSAEPTAAATAAPPSKAPELPPLAPTTSRSPTIKLGGYLHADGRLFFEKGDAVAPIDDFLIRRARPDITVKAGDFVGRLLTDFGGGKPAVQDAYVEWRPAAYAALRFGKYKPPVGLERLQSANGIWFVERALPTNLVPNRDIGLQLSGEIARTVTYALAVVDGAPDLGNIDGDVNRNKELAGRVFVRPFAPTRNAWLEGLGFGVSGSDGITRGSAKAPDVGAYKTDGQSTFFAYRADSKAPSAGNTVVADGERKRWSAHASYYGTPVGVQAEYVLVEHHLALDTTRKTLRNTAWQVAGTVVLTGERVLESGVVPARPVDEGGLGAVQLTARYASLEIDRDTFPTFADPTTSARKAATWSAGVNWSLSSVVRLEVDFARTWFAGGNKDANGNVIPRPEERVVLSRVLFAF